MWVRFVPPRERPPSPLRTSFALIVPCICLNRSSCCYLPIFAGLWVTCREESGMILVSESSGQPKIRDMISAHQRLIVERSSSDCLSSVSQHHCPHEAEAVTRLTALGLHSPLEWLTSDRWASQVSLVVKNLPASAGDMRDTGSIPGSVRSWLTK